MDCECDISLGLKLSTAVNKVLWVREMAWGLKALASLAHDNMLTAVQGIWYPPLASVDACTYI